jgi:hypothetical protein
MASNKLTTFPRWLTANPRRALLGLALALQLCAPAARAQQCTGVAPLPAAWWRGEQLALGADSMGGLHALSLGSALSAPGKVGGAIDLSAPGGSNVTIPHGSQLQVTDAGFSVELWMKKAGYTPNVLFTVVDKSHSGSTGGWTVQSGLDGA